MAYEGYWDEIGNIESENIPESVVLATWETGDVDVVRAWLDNGGAAQLEDRIFITAKHGDRNIAFGTLLTIACESDHPSPIAEMLLDAGADYDIHHLSHAINSGNIYAIRALVPRVDVVQHYGFGDTWTPLHNACTGYYMEDHSQIALPNQAEIVHTLLEAGALVNGRTRRHPILRDRPIGQTPLMLAAKQGFTRLGVVKWLLHYGADISAVDSLGRTALFQANELLQHSQIWTDPNRRAVAWEDSQEGRQYIPCRAPGVVEDMIALLQGVEAAGSWKRYLREPRRDLLTFRRLVERGRAAPPDGVLARLFPESGGLPDVLFWKVLSFWRSSRDA